MTQQELILEYCKEHGSILPAKLYGFVYKDQIFGSELSKRCRELRKAGKLLSEKDGKFERFYLVAGSSGKGITLTEKTLIEGQKRLAKLPEWWNKPEYQRKLETKQMGLYEIGDWKGL